ncbi:MAG: hypothetical protein HOD54_02005 [Candidatus Magasanikbacteria bacterium]|nr:hypothetical protein [Candidatus Magasanikbacteria bacterium]
MKKNLMNLIVLATTLVMACMIISCGGAYEQESVENTNIIENNVLKFVEKSDWDGDGFITGDVDTTVSQQCSYPESENMEAMCLEQTLAALKGGGDCDNNPFDDPEPCPETQAEIDCSDSQYSVCAKCVNTSAVEMLDGVDNDCDGSLMDGECATDADCADGQTCNPDTHQCVGCLTDEACNDDNACTTDTCVDNVCLNDPISGCAASCDPQNDLGELGEDAGDCFPYKPEGMDDTIYGWGCLDSTCVQYEDDGDEFYGDVEYYCDDGIDGDLDGDVDCDDVDCVDDAACLPDPECVDDADCEAGFVCTDGACVEEPVDPGTFDDKDGDCYCGIGAGQCVTSVNDTCAELLEGDCDDDPTNTTEWSVCQAPNGDVFILNTADECMGGSYLFYTDGSILNNPSMNDYSEDGFDNNCNGQVDEGGLDPCTWTPVGGGVFQITCDWL